MAANASRTVTFRVTAAVSAAGLQWRLGSGSSDSISPLGGSIASQGVTDVTLTQTVHGSNLVVEVVSGSSVLLQFTLANY